MTRLPRVVAAIVLAAATTTVPSTAAQATPPTTAQAAPPAVAVGNGLARTPPMGWNDWNAFGCDVTQALVEQTADVMVSSGMAAAGYRYVNIDDCWMTSSRDAAGNLVPDPAKFPGGITETAAYVHSKGLKLGIYEDAGTLTCAGYPGSLGHEQQDARSFAAWGVDYLKYDNCYNNGSTTQQQYIDRYTAMRDALAATGRPIVYSLCEWGVNAPWTWAPNVGNLWRTTDDINTGFDSMLRNFHQSVGLARYAGPDAWNDPDMLEVGNGWSAIEDRAHFSLWAIMAAPLIAGNNLTTASATTLATLTNRAVIAVDQDALGAQGVLVQTRNGLDVLSKRLSNGDVAVVLFNETTTAQPISTDAATIGKSGGSAYTLTDLWTGATSSTTGAISTSVPAHGAAMYRVSGGASGNPNAPAGTLVSAASNRCVDDPNWSQTDGTLIGIWDCNVGTNQLWTRTPAGQLVVYGKCLDAFDNQTTPGTKIELWTCNGGPNQQWRSNADGTITGVQSGLCLDVTGGATTNGTALELWTCTGAANQRWTFT
ncbi:ricin-type beta-trefoil lectin domain protein [Winogradskya consettensis]|uniref:Alpha-galactosidase n=1 Tax=Winogradskya consettensis TaxID=113560 RepID=A0A919SE46_9ACTN|nr:glycoside hydrolase family 27 protein [Actinoplanes consettensis]GIM70085.1 alpha-galactosidase [Actinoplanes consettensis]